MVKSVIILAGGLGTRLREAVPDLPKAMAPVLAKPFIGYVMDYCIQQQIQNFIFALSYRHEVIEQYLRTQYGHCSLNFSIEPEPTGTGGGIRAACLMAKDKTVMVLNGDTFFKVNIQQLAAFHDMCGSHCTLALKPMQKVDRYSPVELNADYSLASFRERKYFENALINGGVYALNIRAFLEETLPTTFSFETDYLQAYAGTRRFFGFIQDEYFIDIGVPEDFERAQTELILNIETHARP